MDSRHAETRSTNRKRRITNRGRRLLLLAQSATDILLRPPYARFRALGVPLLFLRQLQSLTHELLGYGTLRGRRCLYNKDHSLSEIMLAVNPCEADSDRNAKENAASTVSRSGVLMLTQSAHAVTRGQLQHVFTGFPV